MATDQQFCLRWNNHQSTLISVFDSLLENGTLVDCTLAAEGQYLKAHKVVLSACSPYLETLLSQHYEKHPIVILKDVKFTELKSMMDYMYRGEVNISQDQLGTFLKAAESLQIKGLTDNGDEAAAGNTTTKRQDVSSRPSVTEVRNTESKRPAPPGDFSDASREGSISPSSLRKRRRTRRSSQGDDPDSHLDTTSNICDFPINPSQTTPLSVPSSTVVPTPVQNLPKQIVKQEPSISRIENNLNSTIAPESGLLKEKIEPPSEPLLEPKTEYLDYMNNENSIEVEDLTLDDDEDLDSSMDASRPGPSHGDLSNQGYQWPMTGDQSGTDEIFMAAQQAVGAATGQQRDSQDEEKSLDDDSTAKDENGQWRCVLCNSITTDKCLEHKKTCSASIMGRNLECSCGKFFILRTDISAHWKSHCSVMNKSNKINCTTCNSEFGHKKQLKIHKRYCRGVLYAHNVVKKYRNDYFYCNDCSLCFQTEENLAKHKTTTCKVNKFSKYTSNSGYKNLIKKIAADTFLTPKCNKEEDPNCFENKNKIKLNVGNCTETVTSTSVHSEKSKLHICVCGKILINTENFVIHKQRCPKSKEMD